MCSAIEILQDNFLRIVVVITKGLQIGLPSTQVYGNSPFYMYSMLYLMILNKHIIRKLLFTIPDPFTFINAVAI